MKLSRRKVLTGAAAVPVATAIAGGFSGWRWQYHGAAVLVHDPALPAGRAFAEVARADGRVPLALEGDRIRFARQLFAHRPLLVRGVSRHADALLVEEVAAEAGYKRASVKIDGDAIDWTLVPQTSA